MKTSDFPISFVFSFIMSLTKQKPGKDLVRACFAGEVEDV